MSTLPRKNRPRKKQDGVVAVEFALVLPFIVFIFLAAIEISNLNFVRNMANDSAYRVTRALIVPGADSTTAVNDGLDVLTDVGITGTSITVEETDEKITAEVTIPVQENSWSIGMLAEKSSIVESCTLRKSYRPRQ